MWGRALEILLLLECCLLGWKGDLASSAAFCSSGASLLLHLACLQAPLHPLLALWQSEWLHFCSWLCRLYCINEYWYEVLWLGIIGYALVFTHEPTLPSSLFFNSQSVWYIRELCIYIIKCNYKIHSWAHHDTHGPSLGWTQGPSSLIYLILGHTHTQTPLNKSVQCSGVPYIHISTK